MADRTRFRIPHPSDELTAVRNMSDLTKQTIREAILSAGACRVGFAEASQVDPAVCRAYDEWIAAGQHGGMTYLERYNDIRNDPRLLLDGAHTVICCAFDYRQPVRHPLFADYALGADYHEIIRQRLRPVADSLCATLGGQMRICVDTAPIRERYWATRAGIGIIGLNGLLIVDGIGSKVFLAEIIWTGKVAPDQSRLNETCMKCGACLRACPGKALSGDRTLDARRCNSYLTIEHRGNLPEGLRLPGRIYGCDACQDVCPHNVPGVTSVTEFLPSEQLLQLDIDVIRNMDQEYYRSVFRHSAVRRAKLEALLRNASRH